MKDIRLVAALCVALTCATLSYTTFAALIPTFSALWQLNYTQAGIVNGAFIAGYVVAVPLLVSLTDRIDARRILLVSLMLSAVSAAVFSLLADGFWSASAIRFFGGVGLAGTYMPGMKALSDRLSGKAQGRAVSFYSASFYLGLALSVLTTGWIAEGLGWRAAFMANAIEAMAALAIVSVALPRTVLPTRPALKEHALDFRPILRNREAMSYVIGYAAHNWEVFGFHSWVVAFLTFHLAMGEGFALSATEVTTLLLFIAVPAAIFGNEIGNALGRRRSLIGLMTLSAVVALMLGFGASSSIYAVLALTGVYAATTAADSGGLTAGTVAAAEPHRMGATMALHSTLGFFAGMLGPVAFGAALDLTGGGVTVASWGAGFAVLALGVMVGPLVLMTLGRRRQRVGKPG
jgi:MFS family permease